MSTTTCLALSGGIDSAVTMAHALSEEIHVLPVIFEYPSKHNSYEQDCALRLCDYYGLNPVRINLSDVFRQFESSLLSGQGDIPEGHYTDESMTQTSVPCRNLIFASILAGIADSKGMSTVSLGVHLEDHYIYPDCRPFFIDHLEGVISQATEARVGLRVPLLQLRKDQIVSLGIDLGVPFGITRTCYKNQQIACGKCGACVERIMAFEKCNKTDIIEYEE